MPHVKANGIQIYYELSGAPDAPVVMLSNSLGTRLEMWEPQMPALRRYRVLRYDSRGHGRSDAPSGAYSIALLGQDALALLDALGIEQVHFCGLSKGGMVGQWLGAHHGDRLLSLALCATASRIGTAELWNQRIEQSAGEGMAALVDGVAERWFTAGYRATPRPEVEQVRAMILATPAQGYGACCAAIRDMDQGEAVRSIRTPTLLVAGADDPATTVEMMRSLHERIPGSRLIEIAQAAHLVNIEQPERFNRALTSFLDAQSRD
ncbi:MAG TPA: 3-oxoadipate enol-lactonase [Geminicoccaceae bacterium]|nr:3-oxoadipate enol-lactonase [Geminicoccaceae bacterium]